MFNHSFVHLTLPDPALFAFPPSKEPTTLPAPAAGTSLSAPPFSIPENWYNAVFDAKIPFTIAAVYAVTVNVLNAYNKSNGHKPWAISKTRAFFYFVIAHNIFLAIYSGWTFVGMYGALSRSIENPKGPHGLLGTIDSFCKPHGISGPGNAITYNAAEGAWISQSSNVQLNKLGVPDATDLGRLWNEGLAFYGWFFYLSKFYEVLDTLIILAKGKKSSTLQTYHHAGAMMCMWSGMRYMSAPIWIFTFVNSGIHALMYTYYTLTALSFRIPQLIKRSITTMQIMQFVVGASFAAVHLFVTYDIPVQVLSSPSEAIKNAVPGASSVSSALASATVSGVGNFLKKILFRAAGEQGLAENVGLSSQATRAVNPHPAHPVAPIYRTEYQTVRCIDTSGQTFAVWLNVFYLAPLTVLFVRFFIRSYTRRTSKPSPTSEHGIRAVEHAGVDALKGVDRGIHGNNDSRALKDITNGSPRTNGKVANGKATNGKAVNGSVNGKAKH